MWDFFVDYVFGVYGAVAIVLIVLGVAAFLFPQFRLWFAAVAAGIFGIAAVYGKGQRDRAKIEQRRKDEAVEAANKKYDEIERRPDDIDHVKGRLKKGEF